MHPWILGAALWATAAVAAAAEPASEVDCPAAGARVVERFVAADCPTCWADDGMAADPRRAWLLDWIVPAASGDGAALSAAALPEAAARAGRLGINAPARREGKLPPATATLRVNAGPAWGGYFGVQFEARGRVPAGTSAWVALLERLPAGAEGNAQPRRLVRALVGPLPLDGLSPMRPVKHLQAMRWPEGAQPERLQARAWVEGVDGRVLAVAHERCHIARH